MTPEQQKAKIRNWNKFRLNGIIRALENIKRDSNSRSEKEDIGRVLTTLTKIKVQWKRRTK